MNKDIDFLIVDANKRLKSGGIKIYIHRDGGTLHLRGILPPKPGTGRIRPHNQRLYISIPASPTGVRLAEIEAISLRECIDSNRFDWSQFVKSGYEVKLTTIGEWVARFEEDYFLRRRRNQQSEITWKKDYLASFRKLDPDKPLTCNYLESIIIQSPPDSRVRRRLCITYGAIAKFAELDCDFSRLTGNYSIKSGECRNIPTDTQIMQTWRAITNPAWAWVYGVMATYGLRNHEVFRIDMNSFPRRPEIITIQSGKTGFRRVWAIYPEWIDHFNLQEISIPNLNLNRGNGDLGSEVSQWFRRNNLPFHPYDLRHAWAIRSLVYGIDVGLAAEMMGHSIKIHSQLYHRWIQEHHYEQAFKIFMSRDSRPQPPGIPPDKGTT